jgi:hypothetical protein
MNAFDVLGPCLLSLLVHLVCGRRELTLWWSGSDSLLPQDLAEFTEAVRKGGKMGPKVMTDDELSTLFNAVDSDSSVTHHDAHHRTA